MPATANLKWSSLFKFSTNAFHTVDQNIAYKWQTEKLAYLLSNSMLHLKEVRLSTIC